MRSSHDIDNKVFGKLQYRVLFFTEILGKIDGCFLAVFFSGIGQSVIYTSSIYENDWRAIYKIR